MHQPSDYYWSIADLSSLVIIVLLARCCYLNLSRTFIASHPTNFPRRARSITNRDGHESIVSVLLRGNGPNR